MLDGAYVDDGLWMWLCRDCHLGDHRVRRTSGLEHRIEPPTRIERVALVLRRLAVTFGRLGGDVFSVLAGLLARLAEWIAADVTALDAHWPAWREVLA
jgi:hypothetical protein